MNGFHSGLLSKGPEESADGDHDHHLRHHHRHNIHHYHWLWSSGQVGTVSHPKVQTLSNRTPDAQPATAMEGGAADRNQWGGAGGNPHHRGNGVGGLRKGAIYTTITDLGPKRPHPQRRWGPTERGHIYYHYGLGPHETILTMVLGTYGEGPYMIPVLGSPTPPPNGIPPPPHPPQAESV